MVCLPVMHQLSLKVSSNLQSSRSFGTLPLRITVSSSTDWMLDLKEYIKEKAVRRIRPMHRSYSQFIANSSQRVNATLENWRRHFLSNNMYWQRQLKIRILSASLPVLPPDFQIDLHSTRRTNLAPSWSNKAKVRSKWWKLGAIELQARGWRMKIMWKIRSSWKNRSMKMNFC